MEIIDTTNLLAKAALIDNRTVGEADILAWHEAVGHLDYATALAALGEHRKTSAEWVTPAHINANARLIRQREAHAEAATRARYALPAPPSKGVPDWFWERAGIDRVTVQAPPWACPWCGARELEPCVNRGTGERFRGIHPARQQVAASADENTVDARSHRPGPVRGSEGPSQAAEGA